MAAPVSFRWDEEFIARIDAARGLIPRSAYVRAAIEAVIGEGSTELGAIRPSEPEAKSAGSVKLVGERSPDSEDFQPAVETPPPRRMTLSEELAENPGTPLPPRVPVRGGRR